jgi:hypothetical protein
VGDSKPGFFAIASPPDPNNAGVLELLIKEAGEGSAASLLVAQPVGSSVDVSPVQGKVRVLLIAAVAQGAGGGGNEGSGDRCACCAGVWLSKNHVGPSNYLIRTKTTPQNKQL